MIDEPQDMAQVYLYRAAEALTSKVAIFAKQVSQYAIHRDSFTHDEAVRALSTVFFRIVEMANMLNVSFEEIIKQYSKYREEISDKEE